MSSLLNETEMHDDMLHRHEALKFVLLVTHSRDELKALLALETPAAHKPVPITLANYASACIHQAQDLYKYIADVIDSRLTKWTSPLTDVPSDAIEEILMTLWDGHTHFERAACIWVLLSRGDCAEESLKRIFPPQAASLAVT